MSEYSYNGYTVQGKRRSSKDTLPVNLHVFYSSDNYHEEHKKLVEKVKSLTSCVRSGIKISDSDELFLRDLTSYAPDSYSTGVQVKNIEVNEKKFSEKLKYSGFMVLATDDLYASNADVMTSFIRRGMVESHLQVTRDTLEWYLTDAMGNAGMDSQLHLIWMATVCRAALNNKLNRLKQKGLALYPDSFSSVDTVLSEAAGLKVDTLVSGVAVKPASRKTLTIMESFGIRDIPCQISCSRCSENTCDDSEPDDELYYM